MSDKLVKAKETLEAANHASGIVRALFTGFMALTAYVIVVIASTDDMQLLRFSPLKLPLLNIDIDLKGFYTWMPWLYVLFHANLLLLVAFLTDKLFHFENKLQILTYPERINFRKQLHILSFTQYLSGRHIGLFGTIVGLLVWISLAALPILLLLAMLLDFLPAQEVNIVWNHRVAILVEILIVLYFWNNILQKLKRSKWPDGWKPRFWRRLPSSGWALGLIAVLTFYFSWYVALIPLGERELILTGCHKPSDTGKTDLDALDYSRFRAVNKYSECINPLTMVLFQTGLNKPESGNGDLVESGKNKELPFNWFMKINSYIKLPLNWVGLEEGWFRRHLIIRDQVIAANDLDPETLNRLKNYNFDKDIRNRDFMDKILGISLQGRRFRFADFANSWLPKVNFGETINKVDSQFEKQKFGKPQLQGANFKGAQLQNANFLKARMQNVNFQDAGLQGANLSMADMQGANFNYVKANGAIFTSTSLEGASFFGAELQGANFTEAEIAGNPEPRSTNLLGAIFSYASVQGANFLAAEMQGVSFKYAQLQGVNFTKAKLQAADFTGAKMQGSDFHYAELNVKSIKDSTFDYSDISYYKSTPLTKAQINNLTKNFPNSQQYINSRFLERFNTFKDYLLKYKDKKPNWDEILSGRKVYCTDRITGKIDCITDRDSYIKEYFSWINRDICTNDEYGYWVIKEHIKEIFNFRGESKMKYSDYYKNLLNLTQNKLACPVANDINEEEYIKLENTITQTIEQEKK